ncbi:DUF805 domain-containing protein [Polaribacter sp. WD7]|uniref:DUF805 domain-containing protein n=1 Tax=Polaribacter sp. WD7 TaxID=2269061 RepID=UPI000DF303E7|nr:DUF805 domain-containing protein [Polaribacter sp. WD7]RCS26944.1 DUF805 domain-containing protein [Polaribacter sp. WD7]
MDWYLEVLRKYVEFSGRARRKEYWMFVLFHFIFISLLVIILISSTGSFDTNAEPNSIVALILSVYIFGTLLPSIAVTVRRLHDIGKSGWWYFISLVPYIGSFILLIFMCMEGEKRTNKWGKNPKGIGNDDVINQIGRE